MNKKLFIFINVMIVWVTLRGMEREPNIQLKHLKRTGTAEGSKSRRQDGVENKHDIRLDLSSLPEPLSISTNGKQSVKSLQHIKNMQDQKETYRASTGRGSSDVQKETILQANNDNREVNNNFIVDHNEDNRDIIDNIQTKRRSSLGTLSSNNTYSSQDMWNMIQKVNPKLYEYATDNHLSINAVLNCPYDFEAIDPKVERVLKKFEKKKPLTLDAMMEYAHLLDNFNIEPEALAQLVQQRHKYSDAYRQLLAKKFEIIQEKDPDQYLELAFDFMTQTLEVEEGNIKEPSPIHAAHVAIQKEEIANEKQQKLYSLIALGLTLATTLAGYAWAIYGQVSGTATNAPTMSPTGAPTNAPTGFPTGSPI